jgi:hypothetical protein
MIESAAKHWQSLIAAGMLPSAGGFSHAEWTEDASSDLLPLLIQNWRIARDGATRHAQRVNADRMLEWLEPQHVGGASLTLGVPNCDARLLTRWIGPRLAFWPRGIPEGRRVGLASSRLGRDLDSHEAWFKVLRAACAKLDRQQELLVTATSTTTARFVERCARLFDLRVLRIDVDDDSSVSPAKWFQRIRQQTPHESSESLFEVYLSPPLTITDETNEPYDAIATEPSRDRAVVALSDRLLVFHLRRGGHLHKLLQARLADSSWPVASVYVALGPKLVPRKLADELLAAGAVGWMVLDKRRGRESFSISGGRNRKTRVPKKTPDPVRAALIIPIPSTEDWPFLTHCTRRHDGPWPDQTEAEFLDELILNNASDHSALASLLRIVTQQRIAASSDAIRGGHRVVSFTSAPLAELNRLHVFRPHRSRWDFEPYGICIRREWLESLGTRAVCYGDDELSSTLSPDDQPLFQRRQTRSRRGTQTIDWSAECEWRHVGDVSLSELRPDAALLFVPSIAEAQLLVEVSRWPVTVVAPGGST